MAGNRSLGTLTLDLIAKIGGFTTGMDRAARKADDRLRHIQNSVQKFERGFKRVFTGLGAVIGAVGIYKAFSKITEATTAQQQAEAQLNAVMKSTKNAAGLSKDAYIELSKSLQKVTTYGDETVLSTENVLLTFKNIRGPQFKDALGVILDMSTALGQDLKQSAIQVGKAINDPIYGVTQLTRVGVTFTDKQKELIKQLVKTGHAVEAQKIILGELQSEFGGSARAATETFGGALKQLQNAFGDLFEAPQSGTNKAIEQIHELTKLLQDPKVVEGAQNIAAAILSIAGAAAKVVASVPGFTDYLTKVAARSQGFVDPNDTVELDARNQAIKKELDAREGIFKGYFHRISALSRGAGPQAAYDLLTGKNLVQNINLAKTSTADLKKQLHDNEILLKQARKANAAKFTADLNKPKDQPKTDTGKPPKLGPTDKEIKAAQQLRAALDALYGSVVQIQEAADPTQKAYADYANTIRSLDKLGAAAIKKGAKVPEVQAAVAKGVAAANEKLQKTLNEQKIQTEQYKDALLDQLKAHKQSIDAQVEAIGIGTKEAQNKAELATATEQAAKAVKDFQQQYALHPDSMSQEDYDTRLKALKEYWSAYIQQTKDGQQRVDAAQSDWMNGVNKAWQDFHDQQKNTAQEAEQLTTSFLTEGSSALADFISGTKSAGSALNDFINSFESMITQAISKHLLDQLFSIGSSGSTSGNGSGGWLDTAIGAIGSFFGGGKASGGSVQPHKFYQVNEHGPELFSVGGKDFLMTGNMPGKITPNDQLQQRGAGVKQTNNFYLSSPTDPRTQSQIANRSSYEMRRAARLR